MFLPKSEIKNLDLYDVEREWREQIELAHSIINNRPSHLDSHHSAHHYPGISNIFIKLAAEYDLPIRDCLAMREYKPSIKLNGSEKVIYDWTGRGLSRVDLQNQISESFNNIKDDDIIEIVSHPGFSSTELRNISSLNDLREKDYTSLLSLKESRWLYFNGIKLISFSEILRH